MSDKRTTSGGIGFLGMLAILFIGLKLGGVISWAWFWVLSPILIPAMVYIALLLVLAVIVSISNNTVSKAVREFQAERIAWQKKHREEIRKHPK